MEDRNTSYHTEQLLVMQARSARAVSCTERRDRMETSIDMARVSTNPLEEMVKLYPHPAGGFLDDDVDGGAIRDGSRRSK